MKIKDKAGPPASRRVDAETFNYKVVRQFSIMTIVWGIVGMLVGVIIAAQLLWPELASGIA